MSVIERGHSILRAPVPIERFVYRWTDGQKDINTTDILEIEGFKNNLYARVEAFSGIFESAIKAAWAGIACVVTFFVKRWFQGVSAAYGNAFLTYTGSAFRCAHASLYSPTKALQASYDVVNNKTGRRLLGVIPVPQNSPVGSDVITPAVKMKVGTYDKNSWGTNTPFNAEQSTWRGKLGVIGSVFFFAPDVIKV